MIKQQENVDLVTSGRQPSEQDFAQISAWIEQQKSKGRAARKPKGKDSTKKRRAQQGL